jgi:branched-chain amino acid transport system ATP-binding protein
MLEVAALDAWYGQAQILYGVSLAVNAGECVALVGRNGAGKSTTMKAIMGLVAKKRGRIVFRGHDITSVPAYRIGRLGLGWVPEDRRIFTDLTVRENLAVAKQPRREGAPEWTPERLYALFPNLGAMPDRPGGRMSGGEQQMLAVARGLMAKPKLLLLDEPSLGLAPQVIEDLFASLDRLRDEQVTILLVDQMAGLALALADRAYVIEAGKISASGSAAQIAADGALEKAYLGAQ